MIGWNYPLNNHGQEDGLNDPGIETFKGSPYESLAKEISQNSSDAPNINSGRPVEVHFDLHHIPTSAFPARDDFHSILISCRDYWKSNKKTLQFFDSAIKTIAQPQIAVLKVSDFYTTGLLGSNTDDRGTDWHNLVKSVGSSDKGTTKGGSFGIGKHAPFASSQLRTVFYSTKDMHGFYALQGVAKLVTHYDVNGQPTQGTGYYGIKEFNKPIIGMSAIDDFFKRTDVGTDVYIYGFNETPDWETRIVLALIESFFVAIHHNKLIVQVGSTRIDSQTLPILVDKHAESDKLLAGKYYHALTSEKAAHFTDFDDKGSCELFILKEKHYPKSVAVVRGTGMKVFDKKHFRTPMTFAGVCIVKGDDLNAFVRQLEPPSHDAWAPERYEDDPAGAKKMIRKIYDWINGHVRELSIPADVEELDVEGLSQFLPDDIDEEIIPEDNDTPEGAQTDPKPIEITSHTVKPAATSQYGLGASTDSKEGAGTKNIPPDAPPPSPEPHPPGPRPFPEPFPQPDDQAEGEGDEGTSSSATGKRQTKTPAAIRLNRVRIFCSDPDKGVYSAAFESDSSGEGFLSFKVVGDDGTEYGALIASAHSSVTGNAMPVGKDGRIGPISFTTGVREKVTIQLTEPLRCALEVAANVH